MSFEKIERTVNRLGRLDACASFTRSSKGDGSLRINMKGVEFLKAHGIKLIPGDKVDLYFDYDSGRIALLRSHEGQFNLGRLKKKNDTSFMISSKDLTKKIDKKTAYDFEKSDEYDLILVPKSADIK